MDHDFVLMEVQGDDTSASGSDGETIETFSSGSSKEIAQPLASPVLSPSSSNNLRGNPSLSDLRSAGIELASPAEVDAGASAGAAAAAEGGSAGMQRPVPLREAGSEEGGEGAQEEKECEQSCEARALLRNTSMAMSAANAAVAAASSAATHAAVAVRLAAEVRASLARQSMHGSVAGCDRCTGLPALQLEGGGAGSEGEGEGAPMLQSPPLSSRPLLPNPRSYAVASTAAGQKASMPLTPVTKVTAHAYAKGGTHASPAPRPRKTRASTHAPAVGA